MACKYYKEGICNDYCQAKGKDEKVSYAHAKEYCKSSSWYEKCNTYKEILNSGFFGWGR